MYYMNVLLGPIFEVLRDYVPTHSLPHLHHPHQVTFRKTSMATYGSKFSLQTGYSPSRLLVRGKYIVLPLFR